VELVCPIRTLGIRNQQCEMFQRRGFWMC